jgi:HNH endonuclease
MSCEVCGFSFKLQDSSRLHSHHLRPVEHGGDDCARNLIKLCPNCHSTAHILLHLAIESGAIDVYKYYERDHLILEILRYRGEVDLVSQFRLSIINLWNHKWMRLKWTIRNIKIYF